MGKLRFPGTHENCFYCVDFSEFATAVPYIYVCISHDYVRIDFTEKKKKKKSAECLEFSVTKCRR